jgi:hypothetical protein
MRHGLLCSSSCMFFLRVYHLPFHLRSLSKKVTSPQKDTRVWLFIKSWRCLVPLVPSFIIEAIANARNCGEKAGMCRVWFNLASQLTDIDVQIMRFRILACSPHLGQ